MKAPPFWQQQSPNPLTTLLTPFSYLTHFITQYRLNKPSWKAPVPVICCGNLTVGGTGKTTVALELGKYYQQQAIKFAFLTRGYKRKNNIIEPFQVDPHHHTAQDVGDEALLLANLAPTWIGSNRALSARAAINHHAELLIMDDGLQNPTLHQDLPLLVIDGAIGFGNQRLLPAGPLRESIKQGLSRVKACIFIDQDQTGILSLITSKIPVFQTFLTMDNAIDSLSGQSVIAFAGIGRPEKFFQTLQNHRVNPLKTVSFPDHHCYSLKDLHHLHHLQQRYNLPLVTTPKDYVKLPHNFQALAIPLGVHLKWQDPMALHQLKKSIHL